MKVNAAQKREQEATLQSMNETNMKKGFHEQMVKHYKETNLKLEKQIVEERNHIEVERAKLKKAVEGELEKNLDRYRAQAKDAAEQNIEQIEASIHHENLKLAQKTMTQRNTLEYYKKQKNQQQDSFKVNERNM